MGHTRGLGTARDYRDTDVNLGYDVCIHIPNWSLNHLGFTKFKFTKIMKWI